MTKVVCFTQLAADEKISKRSGFAVGTPLFYIQRIHYLDGKALIPVCRSGRGNFLPYPISAPPALSFMASGTL